MRKQKKDPVARVLFPSDAEDEEKDDGTPTGSPDKSGDKPRKRPAAAKAKSSPGPKAKAKSSPGAKAKAKGRGKKVTGKGLDVETGKVGDEKGPKKRRQRNPPKTDDSSGKPKIVKQEVPTFQCSVVVPYWSRGACGLKVPPQKTDGGIASKNWRQVFYLGVRGATMKEHIDIIATIVT